MSLNKKKNKAGLCRAEYALATQILSGFASGAKRDTEDQKYLKI